jgi:predicted metal-dependent peptidase
MEKLTAQKKIEKAKVSLYLDQPFFASILFRFEMIEDSAGIKTRTMATDGKVIYFYPPFVNSITLEEVKGVLAHEVTHVILLHPFRRQGRELKKFNIACDYAVNPIIKDAGFKLCEGHLDDPQYHNMEAETIYNKLPHDPQGQTQPGQGQPQGKPQGKPQGQGQGQPEPCPDPGNMGGVIDYPGTPDQTKQAELEQKMYNVQTAQISKKQGHLPGSFERLIEELTEPRINWKEKLAEFIDNRSRNDFTWTIPNRRYLGQGFYLPSLLSPELGEIICLIDASGSISPQDLTDLVSEIKGILELYEGTELKIIFFDTKATDPFTIQNDTDIKNLKLSNLGGGTNYKPPFEKIEKEGLDPKAIIILTDGQCNNFPKTPDQPALWIIKGKEDYKRFKPPFGQTLLMDDQA